MARAPVQRFAKSSWTKTHDAGSSWVPTPVDVKLFHLRLIPAQALNLLRRRRRLSPGKMSFVTPAFRSARGASRGQTNPLPPPADGFPASLGEGAGQDRFKESCGFSMASAQVGRQADISGDAGAGHGPRARGGGRIAGTAWVARKANVVCSAS